MSKFLSLLFLLFLTHASRAQEFRSLPDSERVELGCNFVGDVVGVYIYKMPKYTDDWILGISSINSSNSGAAKIDRRQFSIDLGNRYKSSDTFVVYIYSWERKLIYFPETITRVNDGRITLGKNHYVLRCEPHNDPWMPNGNLPFMFNANGYYINPKNGKIKKAKRLLQSGAYTACDIESWGYVHPYGKYYDKNRKLHRGSDIIKQGKIKLEEWNFEHFSIDWFRN